MTTKKTNSAEKLDTKRKYAEYYQIIRNVNNLQSHQVLMLFFLLFFFQKACNYQVCEYKYTKLFKIKNKKQRKETKKYVNYSFFFVTDNQPSFSKVEKLLEIRWISFIYCIMILPNTKSTKYWT